ncbi:venom dipeptidyl peptidase 4 isoform X2 [Leptopilina heterotoma]|nr:venom dipeptidyl peptidase 4 isoform X2 [Leptopilina heterotoma]
MSTLRKYRVYDFQRESWSEIANGEIVSLAVWSSVENDLFYVMNNDIYYRQIVNNSINIRRLTFNGVPGIIYNGVPDWVYEEDVLKTDCALKVSSDGKYLLFATFNDTEVKDAVYSIYGKPGELNSQYPSIMKLKYPKAGSTMPTVTLNLLNLTNNSSKNYQVLEAPVDVVGREHLLYNFGWMTNNKIIVTWTNRVQNISQIVTYDLNGKSTYILSLNEWNGWLSPSELFYHNKGYLISLANQDSRTSAGKFMHVTRLNLKMTNNALIDLTPGTSNVLSIIGIDENTNRVYYLATAPELPSQRNFYSVSIIHNSEPICHSCDHKSPEGRQCKYADAKFSLDKSFYALTCNGPDPSTTVIYNSIGLEIFTWQSNRILRNKLSQRLQPIIKDITLTVNGYKCEVKLFLPPQFNEKKKYPMLVKVYAGPNSVRVVDAFSQGLEHYMTTNRSTICALMEGRGSGNKGSKMLFEIYRALGTVEIQDIIDITRNLQEKYSWIDANRTSLWGWSYGGYATGMVLAKDVNSVFKCGIAVAPVVSWIYYDSIYTERYMGLPTDNMAAYNESDLTRLVEGIRGKDFLLIHGTGDDNVHFQNSMALGKALAMKDVPYREVVYPDETHSLSGISSHLYHTIDKFLEKCLKLTYTLP